MEHHKQVTLMEGGGMTSVILNLLKMMLTDENKKETLLVKHVSRMALLGIMTVAVTRTEGNGQIWLCHILVTSN